MHTNIESLQFLSFYKEDFLEGILFNIPHSGTHFPDFNHFLSIQDAIIEHELTCDKITDKIFDVPGIDQLVCNFSRVFCDVERLHDDQEPMFKKGMGWFYEKNDNQDTIRTIDTQYRKRIWSAYYQTYHNKLYSKVLSKIEKTNWCLIVDCHSFNDTPTKRDSNQNLNRPDICIGTDPFHTPKWLSSWLISYFKNLGLSVKENDPYEGCIIPLPLYQKDNRVNSIMIEINKKLYLSSDEDQEPLYSIEKLNKIICQIFGL